MHDEHLHPVDAKQIAFECFAINRNSKNPGLVTRKYVSKGQFPEHDFDLPSASRGKQLWFAQTVKAWRKKFFALQVVNRQKMRALEANKETLTEANALRIEMMKKATAYAQRVSADLMAEFVNEEQRDADHDHAAA